MVWRLMALVDAIPGYSCFGSESRFDEYQLARVEVYTSVSWKSRRLCDVQAEEIAESGKQCLLLTLCQTGFYFRVEAMSFEFHSLR
jgi:hypothetical protein